MATKKNTLTIRVPEDLKQRIEKVATLQGVSINQFALYAFTKEIADLEESSYFQNLLRGVDKKALLQDMDRVLSAVPERPVPDWDARDDSWWLFDRLVLDCMALRSQQRHGRGLWQHLSRGDEYRQHGCAPSLSPVQQDRGCGQHLSGCGLSHPSNLTGRGDLHRRV